MVQKRFWNVERVLAVVFLLLSVFMWDGSREFVRDARRFPELVSGLVFLLSAYLILGQVVQWQRERAGQGAEADKEAPPARRPFLPWWYTLALSIGLILVISAFGLGTGILAFVTWTSRRMGLSWPKAVLYGAVFSGMIWWIFGIVLRIPMPQGSIVALF